MILTHYPAGPQPETWRFDTSRVYAQTRGADNKPCWQALKPRGLWLSYDTGPSVGWAEWCADNVPDWQHTVGYPVEVDLDRCLIIDSIDAAVDFHDRHSVEAFPGINVIDWFDVIRDYAGMFVSRYERGAYYATGRHMIWYEAWDCASAVIWDLTALRPAAMVPHRNTDCLGPGPVVTQGAFW